MPQYLSPGVYVEEISSGSAPIAGVGTSTAGFVGVAGVAEVEPVRARLEGRTLQQDIYRRFAQITADNFNDVIAAIAALPDGEKPLYVRRRVPIDQLAVGMILDEKAAGTNNQTYDAGTTLTQAMIDDIKAAQAAPRELAAAEAGPTAEGGGGGGDAASRAAGVTPRRSGRAANAPAPAPREVVAAAAAAPELRVRVEINQGNQALLTGQRLPRELRAAEATFNVGDKITEANFDDAQPDKLILPLLGAGWVQVSPAVDVETPQLITDFGQFRRLIGPMENVNSGRHSALAHAVYGFFNNGGTRCWVARVDNLNAASVRRALERFGAVDEIAIVAAPGALDVATQSELLDHCERFQDRFAVLDGQRAAATEATVDNIQGGLRDSNYGALYYPWIKVIDPVMQLNNPTLPADKVSVYVGPSGHIAGIYARVDTERGVHKAPANEIIRGALDVEARLGRAEQDGLNPLGINVIRRFDGNIRVWGARTLGGDANGEWKYINVRRLFLFLRESIEEGTQWVVFEPNDRNLWAKITRNITAFLTIVWRNGALFGATPQEAFFVKCDDSTNPPEVRDLGQVITEIGVAVVKPAEFVIFRISQWAGPNAS